jgi:thiamine biosynthesis protein ThiI
LPYEDCCTLFVPKSPSTNPNLRIVERVEAQLGEQLDRLVEEAVQGTEMLTLTETTRSDASAQAAGIDDWF